LLLNDLIGGHARIVQAGPGALSITGLALDSRVVAAGNLFAALPGAKVDGLSFVPAAVAAALAGSSGRVVCVTGDGGFLMHAGEMITARRNGLKIIVIVFSDGELNLIKVKQSWKKISPYGIQLYSGDLFGAGRFLGADVIRVTDAAGMRSALRSSLSSGGSVIIEAVVDPACYDDLIVRSL